ncbi:hypothetical protein DFH06DRAFT_985513 [Mycena polygramma]|nr:hypothetical protein DFH06DRAFT_985513 [Mycena polygramma]
MPPTPPHIEAAPATAPPPPPFMPPPPPHIEAAPATAPPPPPFVPPPPPRVEPAPPPPFKSWLSKDLYFEVSAANLGGGYDGLLEVWTSLERAFKYEKSSGKVPWNAKTASRPVSLEKWVRVGRGLRGTMGKGEGPDIGNVQAFEQGWWQWWAGVQPGWREKDVGRVDRFIRGGYPAPTGETWNALRHPGPNGALSFVATLYWWGKAVWESGASRDSWSEAVQEVRWVLSGLLDAEKNKAGNK